jgi:hypothetical protein
MLPPEVAAGPCLRDPRGLPLSDRCFLGFLVVMGVLSAKVTVLINFELPRGVGWFVWGGGGPLWFGNGLIKAEPSLPSGLESQE